MTSIVGHSYLGVGHFSVVYPLSNYLGDTPIGHLTGNSLLTKTYYVAPMQLPTISAAKITGEALAGRTKPPDQHFAEVVAV